ncbi:uncharacterized protein [Cherax quadricarinatus]|uniref:uncharacterized protein n=1 Tax=Cherax quadricarinatus TaxID=27406 RepID=UPI00387EBEA3
MELLPEKKKRRHKDTKKMPNLSTDNQEEDIEAENQMVETEGKENTKKKKNRRLENESQEGMMKQSEVSLPQTPVMTHVTTSKKHTLDQESPSKKKKCRNLLMSLTRMLGRMRFWSLKVGQNKMSYSF